MGPMAQDFHAAFGLGHDDRHINSIDTGGVTIAALQGLYEMVQELQAESAILREENDRMRSELNALRSSTSRQE
jgi:hypothetical protein